MKRLAFFIVSLFVIVLIGVFLVPGRANRADPAPVATPPRTITAIGSATVSGKPDSARVYFGIVTHGNTVAAAHEENARAVGRVQTALLALKLSDLKTRTRNSRVSINYADRDETKIVGYEVRQSSTALSRNPIPTSSGSSPGVSSTPVCRMASTARAILSSSRRTTPR